MSIEEDNESFSPKLLSCLILQLKVSGQPWVEDVTRSVRQ